MMYRYFNPRLYAGGDSRRTGRHGDCRISIHASTREATVHRVCHWICPEISIHASTREATLVLVISKVSRVFQSTPLRERRRDGVAQSGKPVIISIHASTREATMTLMSLISLRIFQSTPLRERRPTSPIGQPPTKEFQSTPLRERRLTSSGTCLHI